MKCGLVRYRNPVSVRTIGSDIKFVKFDVEMVAIRQKCTAAILQVIIRAGLDVRFSAPSTYLGS